MDKLFKKMDNQIDNNKGRCEDCDKMKATRKYDACFYGSKGGKYQGRPKAVVDGKMVYECLKGTEELTQRSIGG